MKKLLSFTMAIFMLLSICPFIGAAADNSIVVSWDDRGTMFFLDNPNGLEWGISTAGNFVSSGVYRTLDNSKFKTDFEAGAYYRNMIKTKGMYNVEINIPTTENSSKVYVEVNGAAEKTMRRIDTSSCSAGWNSIGTFLLDENSEVRVTATEGGSTLFRVDAARFTPNPDYVTDNVVVKAYEVGWGFLYNHAEIVDADGNIRDKDYIDSSTTGSYDKGKHYYYRADDSEKGKCVLRYRAGLTAGVYNVYAWIPLNHVAWMNKATVNYSGGSDTMTYSNTDSESEAEAWRLLGTYYFDGAAEVTLAPNKNADGRLDAVKFERVAQTDEVIIDDEKAEFTGTWHISNNTSTVTPYNGSHHYTSEVGASAAYKAAVTGGYYTVYAWSMYNAADVPVKAVINTADGEVIKYYHANEGALGDWMPIGTYKFNNGMAKIVLSAYAGGSTARADAIKLTRVDVTENEDIYVSKTGSDENDGSAERPYLTVAKAFAAADASAALNVNVYIDGGEYEIGSTLKLSAQQGSFAQKNITVIGNGSAVLSGGKRLEPTFTEYDGKIVCADIGTGYDFRQLYVNGEKAIRSRYPNVGEQLILGSDLDLTNGTVAIDASAMTEGITPNETEISVKSVWAHRRLRIKSINAGTATIADDELKSLNSDQLKQNRVREGAGYWLENNLAFVDNSGEWYYNKSEGKLYYFLRDGEAADSLSVVVPMTDTIVSVDGTAESPAKNVTLENLSFKYTNWAQPNGSGFADIQANLLVPSERTANSDFRFGYEKDYIPGAVNVSYGENIKIKNCGFEKLGGAGIVSPRSVSSLEISDNSFSDIAASAIFIGEDFVNSASDKYIHKNVDISRNTIDGVSSEYWGGPGITVFYVTELNISQNTLRNLPYTGISANWGWDASETVNGAKNYVIGGNRVENYMSQLHDGGGIYVPNPLRGDNNVIEYNYISTPYEGANGIYHDGDGKFINDYYNVIEAYKPVAIQNYGDQVASNITISNNFVTSAIQSNGAENVVVSDNTVFEKGSMPAAAQSIVRSSGANPETVIDGIEGSMGGSVTVYYTNMRKTDRQADCICAVYNGGTLEKIYKKSVVLSALTRDGSASCEFEIGDINDSTELKYMLWDSIMTMMPLSEAN